MLFEITLTPRNNLQVRSNSFAMKTTLFLSLLIGVFIIYALGDITEVENNCHCGAHDRCCQDAQLGTADL